MNYFQRRQLKKQIKHILHDARHARHMREDVASPEDIDAVLVAEQAVKEAWGQKDYAAAERAAEELIQRTRVIFPPKPHPRIREYVEIFVVAIGVAMAFRSYFIQPFKIPTGSMQPTLYGIVAEPQVGRGTMDRFPLNLVSLAVFGDRYVEVRAARSGVVEQLVQDETYIFSLNGVVPPFRHNMAQHFEAGEFVSKGQLLASGRVRSGDHIFVNKVRYNFSRPQRGDVFVFNTQGIDHPQVKPDTFYIKRLVGMPGETIRLQPPYLLANDQRILEPDVFRRQAYDRHLGYEGYKFAPPGHNMPLPVLGHPRASISLGDKEYLAFGDNTTHSLDGRYFGAIARENVVGPAFKVYWPISDRWGWIR